MRVTINGDLQKGVTPKDVTLAVIGKSRNGRGNWLCNRVRGICNCMSIEGRMTVCNMAIEVEQSWLVAMTRPQRLIS